MTEPAYGPGRGGGRGPAELVSVADAVRDRFRECSPRCRAGAAQYGEKADPAAARDAAVMLCRIAFDAPAYDAANAMSAVIVQPGAYGRDLRCRRRDTQPNPIGDDVLAAYDRIFGQIKGNPGWPTRSAGLCPGSRRPRT